MAKLTKDEFISALKEMTILEVKELVDGMKEELGIDISHDNIIKAFEVKYDKEKRNFVDIYLLEKEVDIKEIILQTSEVSDIRYFSLNKLIDAHNSKDSNFVNHSFFPDLIKYIKKFTTFKRWYYI